MPSNPASRNSSRSKRWNGPALSAPSTETSAAARRKPTLAQRAVAFAFLGAFALTMLTVVLTGLNVQSPRARAPANPAVTLVRGEPRTVYLVFAARSAVADVELTVALPPGVELAGRPGERRVVLRTQLARGDNALPLALVARDGPGGALGVRLESGEGQKTFVLDVAVAPP
jgi:hypothetical protein